MMLARVALVAAGASALKLHVSSPVTGQEVFPALSRVSPDGAESKSDVSVEIELGQRNVQDVVQKSAPASTVATTTVAGNEEGATLRVLYSMARECYGVEKCSDGVSRGRNSMSDKKYFKTK